MIPTSGPGGLRRFSGVGYTGAVIEGHPHWGDVVFDMSQVSLANKVPIFLEHDANRIVGFADSHRVSETGALEIGGVLSSVTEASKQVAALSDDGYPWQMSIRIEPEYVEKVEAGSSVTVNGRVINGPVNVFRNGKISEVSFTSMGWDSDTVAIALSSLKQPLSTEVLMTESVKRAEDSVDMQMSALRAENAALLSELNALKTAFSELEKRDKADCMSRLAAAFKDCGVEKTEADLAKFSSFNREQIDDVIAALGAKPQPVALPDSLTRDVALAAPTFSKPGEGYVQRLAARFGKGAK